MKKFQKTKHVIAFTAALLLCIAFFYICTLVQNETFFASSYQIVTNEKEVHIPVPKLSYLKTKEQNKVTFQTFRSKTTVQREINNYLIRLKNISCSGNLYHYDEKNNITIIKYHLNQKNNFLLHTIELEYELGNICPKEIDNLKF